MANKLTLVSKLVTENVKTVIGEKDVFFSYQYDETKPELLNIINFQRQDADGNMFSGVISGGAVNFNGVAKMPEDYAVIPEIINVGMSIISEFKARATPPPNNEKTD